MTIESQSTFCHKCGVKSRVDGLFCHQCGASLKNTDSDQEFVEEQTPDNSSRNGSLQFRSKSTPKTWPGKTAPTYLIGFLVLTIIGAGIYMAYRPGETSPNARAEYASDPNIEGSIASMISDACSAWSDLKNGPDLQIVDKEERGIDYANRKTNMIYQFAHLDVSAQSAIQSTVFWRITKHIMDINQDSSVVDTSKFPVVEAFCNSSPRAQIQPYLDSPRIKAAQTNLSDTVQTDRTDSQVQTEQSVQPKPNGHWEMKCSTMEYPNPNYDPYKGPSAIVNEPTIKTQNCSQVWVNN